MPIVKAQCTNCGAALEVDQSLEAAICPYCNTPYIVEKAINNYITNINNNITAQNVTVLGGKDFNVFWDTAKTLLGVSHDEGIKACNECISLQPSNYEVRALYVKYYLYECIVAIEELKVLKKLTPADKIQEVFDDLYDCWLHNLKHSNNIYSYIDGYFYLLDFFPPDKRIPNAMQTMQTCKKFRNGDLMINLIKQRIWEDYQKCSEAYKRVTPFPFSRLCMGEEKPIMIFDNVYVRLNYNDRDINNSFLGSTPKGKITLTNYKVTFQTNKEKTSFVKNLENLALVTCNTYQVILEFKDGYKVISSTEPIATGLDWQEIIDNALLI